MWQQHFDFTFDKNYWIHHFIYDLIENNQLNQSIGFSAPFSNAFKDINEFIFRNVIMSKEIMDFDNDSKEKIKTIFDYCIKNPDYVAKKYGNGNKYKIDKYGIERAVVDFIQWCGDELIDELYNYIKK